jgi:hypothetical protein
MKKRKHHETCPSCAFVHAHRLKYGKNKYSQKAFNDMVHAAVKISAIIMAKLDNEGKAQYLANVVRTTAELEGVEIGVEVINGSTGEPSVAKGPTKH